MKTTIPGTTVAHVDISPTCRANRGTAGMLTEAQRQVADAYRAAVAANPSAHVHVVVTVQQP